MSNHQHNMWLDQQRRETLQSVERDASGRRIRGITPAVAQPEAEAPLWLRVERARDAMYSLQEGSPEQHDARVALNALVARL